MTSMCTSTPCGVHGAVLQRPDELEAGAVADVGQARVGVGTERPLVDAALPGAVEHGAPPLQLEHALRRFLGVQLRHAPVVDELAALHRVGEVDLPRVLVGDVVHRRRDPALGHHRVGLAEQRLADDQHARAGLRRRDRAAQAGAAGTEDEHVGLDRLVRRRSQRSTAGRGARPPAAGGCRCRCAATETRLAQAHRSCLMLRTVTPSPQPVSGTRRQRAREAVELSAREVAEGVAAERVAGQQERRWPA